MREYTDTDMTRQQLKLFSCRYNLHMKIVVSAQNNLILLLDFVFSSVNELFTSPIRDDGRQTWADFVCTFYHCDCIAVMREAAFAKRYTASGVSGMAAISVLRRPQNFMPQAKTGL